MEFSLRTVLVGCVGPSKDEVTGDVWISSCPRVVDVVEFEVGVIAPHQLTEAIIAAPVVDPTRGVVLSGRGPVWLYGALVHHYHATSFVACYDPRLGGGVVVESHTPAVVVGAVVVIPQEGVK